MGNKNSRQLKRKEIKTLISETHFTQEEIRSLYQRFCAIDDTLVSDGVIDKEEFLSALGLKHSTFGDRIFAVFDENGDNEVNFKEFCCALSILCDKGTLEEKIEFTFKVYDIDGDGCIDKDELFGLLKASLMENMVVDIPETALRALVDQTFDEADDNNDGYISFEEYKQLVLSNPNIVNSIRIDPKILGDVGSNSPSTSTA